MYVGTSTSVVDSTYVLQVTNKDRSNELFFNVAFSVAYWLAARPCNQGSRVRLPVDARGFMTTLS